MVLEISKRAWEPVASHDNVLGDAEGDPKESEEDSVESDEDPRRYDVVDPGRSVEDPENIQRIRDIYLYSRNSTINWIGKSAIALKILRIKR